MFGSEPKCSAPYLLSLMTSSTFHTYPDLLHSGDRLARTDWLSSLSVSEVVAATLRIDSTAVILRAVAYDGSLRGLAPGGLAS